MPRGDDISNVERTFILDALHENLRVDGRQSNSLRKLDIQFGEEYGSAIVSLGKTKVAVQISAEVTKPLDDRKFDGIFIIVAELSPIASASFDVGRSTEQEVVLSRLLEKAIRRSNAIDTESLCIVAGAKCWSVRADVHVIDADGGLLDASCVAIMAALRHFRRPDVSVNGEDVVVYTMAERVPVPLSIMHNPVCLTFSFYHDGEVVLLDANRSEELVRDAEMVLTVNDFELCQIAKLGGIPISPLILLNCTVEALSHAKGINQLVSKALAADTSTRDVGGLVAELSAENDRLQ